MLIFKSLFVKKKQKTNKSVPLKQQLNDMLIFKIKNKN